MANFDEDLDLMFEDDEFNTCAEFTISAGNVLTVKGTFAAASQGVLMFGSVEVEAAKPSFTARTSCLTTVRPKMAVTIDDVAYTVEKVEPVGVGPSVVWLKT